MDISNDGVMFDLYAMTKVTAFTMDLILNYVGMVNTEIYFRRGSMSGREFHPSAWTKIASFEIYGKGFGAPVRLPDGAFDEITIHNGETVAFYITATNGAFLQITEYKGQKLQLHETTDHVKMFVVGGGGE